MIILGLGSNTGDRLAFLSAAVKELLPHLTHARFSSILESEALLVEGSPANWNLPFLNMAIGGMTGLAPEALCAEIKAIEKKLGRVDRGKWAPREIDIDILAMDELVMQSQDLHIPHSELLNRDFALLPLAELVPEWRYPLTGEFYGHTARDIALAKGYALNGQLKQTGMSVRAA
jgi:2-amino-4-hydroxy-6-hydroxymethyldihydropteridine diphosphokinase / dihydropteroate synthase